MKNALFLFIKLLIISTIISSDLSCQEALSAQISPTPTGKCKGAIDLVIQNGHPLYKVAWVGPSGPYPITTSNGNDGQEDLDKLCAGNYCVTVTDALCGTASTCFEVEECPFIDVSGSIVGVNPPSNCNEQDGSISINQARAKINGTPCNTCQFHLEDIHGNTIQGDNFGYHNLGSGKYFYIATDENGCTGSLRIELISEDGFYLTENIQNSCPGQSNGSIQVYALSDNSNETFDFNWSNGFTQNDVPWGDPCILNNLSHGWYCVTVTSNITSCLMVDCYDLPSIQANLEISESIVHPCGNFFNGSINLNPAGGVFPYSYIWENGSASNARSILGNGVYCVTVTDYCGLTLSDCFELNALDINLNKTEGCSGDNSVEAIVSGGEPPYTYYWSNGSTSNKIINLNSGSYCVTVSDALGNCNVHECVTVESSDFSDHGLFIPCTGINEGKRLIKIFNPLMEIVRVELSDGRIIDGDPMLKEQILELNNLNGDLPLTIIIQIANCTYQKTYPPLGSKQWSKTDGSHFDQISYYNQLDGTTTYSSYLVCDETYTCDEHSTTDNISPRRFFGFKNRACAEWQQCPDGTFNRTAFFPFSEIEISNTISGCYLKAKCPLAPNISYETELDSECDSYTTLPNGLCSFRKICKYYVWEIFPIKKKVVIYDEKYFVVPCEVNPCILTLKEDPESISIIEENGKKNIVITGSLNRNHSYVKVFDQDYNLISFAKSNDKIKIKSENGLLYGTVTEAVKLINSDSLVNDGEYFCSGFVNEIKNGNISNKISFHGDNEFDIIKALKVTNSYYLAFKNLDNLVRINDDVVEPINLLGNKLLHLGIDGKFNTIQIDGYSRDIVDLIANNEGLFLLERSSVDSLRYEYFIKKINFNGSIISEIYLGIIENKPMIFTDLDKLIIIKSSNQTAYNVKSHSIVQLEFNSNCEIINSSIFYNSEFPIIINDFIRSGENITLLGTVYKPNNSNIITINYKFNNPNDGIDFNIKGGEYNETGNCMAINDGFLYYTGSFENSTILNGNNFIAKKNDKSTYVSKDQYSVYDKQGNHNLVFNVNKALNNCIGLRTMYLNNNHLHLYFDSNSIVYYTIFDPAGKFVGSTKAIDLSYNGNFNIDIENIFKGLYFLKIWEPTENCLSTYKFIKY